MHELTLGRVRKLAADGRAGYLTLDETVQVLAQAILALEEESQELQEAWRALPPATGSPITDRPWAATEPESTARETLLSSLSALHNTAPGLVEPFFKFVELVGALPGPAETHALDAALTTLICLRQACGQSAPVEDAAKSSSTDREVWRMQLARDADELVEFGQRLHRFASAALEFEG